MTERIYLAAIQQRVDCIMIVRDINMLAWNAAVLAAKLTATLFSEMLPNLCY
jgi:hypothetical protein